MRIEGACFAFQQAALTGSAQPPCIYSFLKATQLNAIVRRVHPGWGLFSAGRNLL